MLAFVSEQKQKPPQSASAGVDASLTTHESAQDRCPGALRPWIADDGAIVRVRVPGGRIRSDQLRELSALAQEFGDGDVHLTARGNLEMRGLPTQLPDAVAQRLMTAGFLPSQTHERARNIFAAPDVELDDVARRLDEALIEQPDLAALPGRFAFAIANADGVGLEVPFDLGMQLVEDGAVLIAGGRAVRVDSVDTEDAVALLIDLALAFLQHRPDETVWNVRDLATDSAFWHAFTQVGQPCPMPNTASWPSPPDTVGAPLGLLSPVGIEALCETSAELVVLPNRTLALRSQTFEESDSPIVDHNPLYVAGLVVNGQSSYNQISACIGAPGCRRTTCETLNLAHDLAFMTQDEASLPRLHISGCERRCGRPVGEHIDIVNPTSMDEVRSKLGVRV